VLGGSISVWSGQDVLGGSDQDVGMYEIGVTRMYQVGVARCIGWYRECQVGEARCVRYEWPGVSGGIVSVR